MTVPTQSRFWRRLDTDGTEHVRFEVARGLAARGTALAATPVPHTCGYELVTDPDWASLRFAVTAEGAGWRRTVTLERAAGRWRITSGEQGDLDRALRAAGHPPAGQPGTEDPYRLAPAHDVDLGGSPLTNTLPVRRLGLLSAPAGTGITVVVAWVLVPSLTVLASEQTYTALGDGRIRFASGRFTADLTLDQDGFVQTYPGLATSI